MDGNYVPTDLVSFFHSIPHINISFHHVSSTFNPTSSLYLESLGLVASVPALWLVLTLLVLLTYLLSRCCDKKLRQGRSLTCHRWLLGISAFLCSCAVAVGLYGNDDMHNAIVRFSTSLHGVQHNIDAVKNQSMLLKGNLESQSFPLAEHLAEVVEENPTLANVSVQHQATLILASVAANISTAMADLTLLEQRLVPSSSLTTFYHILDLVELFRWPATMAVLSTVILFCLILIFAVVRRLRCLLVTFAVIGLFSIIINWCAASVYLAVIMGLADLCHDPSTYVESLVAQTYGHPIADYYIHCPVDGAVKESGPLNTLVRQARLNIEKSEQLVAQFVTISETHYSAKYVQPSLDKLSRSLKVAAQSLASLAGLVDCGPMHRRYLEMTDSVCNRAMFGLTFMLASAAGAGLVFTILVLVDSHVWIYLRKKKGYLQVAEQDTFLPASSSAGSSSRGGAAGAGGFSLNRTSNPPTQTYSSAGTYPGRHAHYRHTHTPPQTPPFPGTLNGRGNHGHHNRHDHPSAPPLLLGPNNGQYPTLSKSCKTLESSDFY